MPTPTYVALAKTVLTGSQNYVDFTAIPQTYNDLVVLVSARNDSASTSSSIYVRNNLASFSSARGLSGNGSTASSDSYANQGSIPAANSTSNTFGNAEFYIANYTSAGKHQTSSSVVNENNVASTISDGIKVTAAVDSQTVAITSLRIQGAPGDFVSGSRFDLYGIKNS